MIKKYFGKDFRSEGGALTLDVSEVSDDNPQGGTHTKTHADGWTITGRVHEDHYAWVGSFRATHPQYGIVEGDFENEVIATSEDGFNNFYENHKPIGWDYASI